MAIAEPLELPLVATNAVQYARRQDAQAAAVLEAMQLNRRAEDARGSIETNRAGRELPIVSSANAVVSAFKNWRRVDARCEPRWTYSVAMHCCATEASGMVRSRSWSCTSAWGPSPWMTVATRRLRRLPIWRSRSWRTEDCAAGEVSSRHRRSRGSGLQSTRSTLRARGLLAGINYNRLT
jgi:hypothetical protein